MSTMNTPDRDYEADMTNKVISPPSFLSADCDYGQMTGNGLFNTEQINFAHSQGQLINAADFPDYSSDYTPIPDDLQFPDVDETTPVSQQQQQLPLNDQSQIYNQNLGNYVNLFCSTLSPLDEHNDDDDDSSKMQVEDNGQPEENVQDDDNTSQTSSPPPPIEETSCSLVDSDDDNCIKTVVETVLVRSGNEAMDSNDEDDNDGGASDLSCSGESRAKKMRLEMSSTSNSDQTQTTTTITAVASMSEFLNSAGGSISLNALTTSSQGHQKKSYYLLDNQSNAFEQIHKIYKNSTSCVFAHSTQQQQRPQPVLVTIKEEVGAVQRVERNIPIEIVIEEPAPSTPLAPLSPLPFSEISCELPKLPVDTKEDFEKLNAVIAKYPLQKEKLVRDLSLVGGPNARKFTIRVLKEIMKFEVRKLYNWAGRSGKVSFKECKILLSVIYDAVRRAYPNETNSNFEDVIKTWLKNAR